MTLTTLPSRVTDLPVSCPSRTATGMTDGLDGMSLEARSMPSDLELDTAGWSTTKTYGGYLSNRET